MSHLTHTASGWLDVNHNRLTGSIPTELGLCSALCKWIIQTLSLVTLDPPHASCFEAVLWLQKNKLSGSFPSALLSPRSPLSKYDRTHSLPKSDNQRAANPVGLDLRGNQMVGTLPSEIGNAKELGKIWESRYRTMGCCTYVVHAQHRRAPIGRKYVLWCFAN